MIRPLYPFAINVCAIPFYNDFDSIEGLKLGRLDDQTDWRETNRIELLSLPRSA